MTHFDQKIKTVKLPHKQALLKSNPDIDLHIIVGEDSKYGKFYDWKNSDQQLRKWLKTNIDIIKYDHIAIIEWDTLITCDLPRLPDNLDLASKYLLVENTKLRNKTISKSMRNQTWSKDNWMWWREVDLLELNDDRPAIGLVSFGFYLIRKWVLQNICEDRWDRVFAKSIQNELRFPTIASLCGASIGSLDLPFVEFYDVKPQQHPGIYHGVNFTNE
jgi:hypothetical protein